MRVFITGSTRGFGLELAKAFWRAKYEPTLNGRSKLTFNTPWNFKQCRMEELTREDFMEYSPDIIINNGFNKADCFGSLGGQVHVLQEAISYFYDRGGGKIINVNSSKGLVADVDCPEYAMAKWGLRGYSESVKFGAYKNGINIIDIYPGAINIGMGAHRDDTDELIDAKELSEFIVTMCETKKFIVSTIHFNRVGVKNAE